MERIWEIDALYRNPLFLDIDADYWVFNKFFIGCSWYYLLHPPSNDPSPFH
ncbi:MAG: hypothetical protein ACTSR8_01860 [Promethearchaeota archaeon]